MKCPTPWLGTRRGYLTDWITQRWVCLTGRRIDPAANEWLTGPAGEIARIGPDFFEKLAAVENCELLKNANGAGLIKDFHMLGSDEFSAGCISPEITRFYQSTSSFDMDVWSEWCSVFRPFGWLLRFLFSHRLQQLHMPISPLETSRGITSDIVQLRDKNTGRIRYVGWLRTMVQSGDTIYAGLYSVCTPPKHQKPCVKIVFPLPNGNATVIMEPEACANGSLKLHSRGNVFGDPGFYFLVRDANGGAWARYVRTMKEMIHVYIDEHNVLRADHTLRIFGLVFLRLHYRIVPRTAAMTQRLSQVEGLA